MSEQENTKNNGVEQKPRQVQMEEDILKFWDEQGIFQKTLEKTKNNKPYVFFDGPPFATGLPHYGHILVSTIKDAIPRYWTMKGYYVRRRWGWDCHGLPIEQLVEQKLGISGKKQIEQIGIEKFNQVCRENVLNYAHEWGKTVRRIARFVEFENSYKTMDSTYMESVWWALKQVWDKQLIYEGRKVLLYCPRCETPLSNFEVAMDNSYDDVSEESVFVRSEITNIPANSSLGTYLQSSPQKAYFLFWTTTPWTLPANVALAVGPDIAYALIRPRPEDPAGMGDGACYVLAKNKVEILFNNPEILAEFNGSDLVGSSYQPLFNVPALHSDKSFKVYAANFVTTEDGTGIVHTAVVYGEDDYNMGIREGLPVVPLLNQQGLFNELSPEFLRGQFYKKTEPAIIDKLAENKLLFKKEVITHSVAFCWRCGTRLYYNAIPAWFINILKIKPRLRELNKESINWYPSHLKFGRFDKGLENAPDWNISRNRYWATALPFWKCTNKSCGRVVCIGSFAELQEKAINYDEVYSSRNITNVDLHRPYIDRIKFECGVCKNEMHRVEEVVDCWVESGSMPFAEFHYPFENTSEFEKRFPGQFIVEYINQTRAWFYVMHVMSTLLFDKAPFQNVLTTGVVLAADGQKMSKSKGNFPDPWLIFDKYGVDALRFYLLQSPVMVGENLAFSEKELDEISKKLLALLSNVHAFLRMYSSAQFREGEKPDPKNILDQWILALLHQLQIEVTKNMDNYDTVRATRPMLQFVNELSTWYLRRSRDRIKEGQDDAKETINVLAYVLIEFCKLAAPFTPFIAEHIYKDLTKNESVHLCDWNLEAAERPLDEGELLLLQKMGVVRFIVELGLSLRKEANFKVRQPLSFLAYNLKEPYLKLELGGQLDKIIAEELNVKEVHAAPELSKISDTVFKESAEGAVLLNTALTPELKEEGLARELERQIQDLRKKLGFKVGDLIDVYYNTSDTLLEMALINKFDRKKTFTSQVKKELEVEADYETQLEVDGKPIWIGIVKI